MIKLYQIEKLSFIYTPSHMSIACLDIALNQILQQMDTTLTVNICGDLTAYFPEIELSIWDKVGDIKKQIKDYRGVEKTISDKIRNELAKFHLRHPEFLQNLDEARKK